MALAPILLNPIYFVVSLRYLLPQRGLTVSMIVTDKTSPGNPRQAAPTLKLTPKTNETERGVKLEIEDHTVAIRFSGNEEKGNWELYRRPVPQRPASNWITVHT